MLAHFYNLVTSLLRSLKNPIYCFTACETGYKPNLNYWWHFLLLFIYYEKQLKSIIFYKSESFAQSIQFFTEINKIILKHLHKQSENYFSSQKIPNGKLYKNYKSKFLSTEYHIINVTCLASPNIRYLPFAHGAADWESGTKAVRSKGLRYYHLNWKR